MDISRNVPIAGVEIARSHVRHNKLQALHRQRLPIRRNQNLAQNMRNVGLDLPNFPLPLEAQILHGELADEHGNCSDVDCASCGDCDIFTQLNRVIWQPLPRFWTRLSDQVIRQCNRRDAGPIQAEAYGKGPQATVEICAMAQF